MTRPMITIVNCTTNEVINREMNDEEYNNFLTVTAVDSALEGTID